MKSLRGLILSHVSELLCVCCETSCSPTLNASKILMICRSVLLKIWLKGAMTFLKQGRVSTSIPFGDNFGLRSDVKRIIQGHKGSMASPTD